MNILNDLRDIAVRRSRDYDPEMFVIRGLWKTELLFKPNVNERTFAYTYILAQTTGQGCCYVMNDPELDESLMGKNALEAEVDDLGVSIALLDAVYSAFDDKPSASYNLDGFSAEKTIARTAIVVDEVMELGKLIEKTKGPKLRAVNVGVVGNIIKELVAKGVDMRACDLDPTLIGREIHGVMVENGDRTLDEVATADIAVVTGMTLATQTLDDILKTAIRENTKVVMFNETAANMGEALCRLGVDVAVSERFPFYIFQGRSVIDIFRKRDL